MHSSVIGGGIGKGNPYGAGFDRLEGPIKRVLVPAHGFVGVSVFDEEVGSPHVEIRTDQSFHVIQNTIIHADIIEKTAGFMPFADFLTGFPGFEKA